MKLFKGDWIEYIPEDWDQKRIKYLFDIKKIIAGKPDYDVISITQKGAKIKNIESGEGQLSMDYSKYQLVEKGDFLMNHMDLLTGFVDISKFNGVTSPDYRVFYLKEKNMFPKYLLYIFQHCYISKVFYGYGRGSSKLGRWRLPAKEFNNFYFPIPSFEEQIRITGFLDRKSNQIDHLLEKISLKIKLLKEQKLSLITNYLSQVITDKKVINNRKIKYIFDLDRDQISASQLDNKTIFHYSIPFVQEFGTGFVEEGSNIESNKFLITKEQLLISKLNPRKSTLCIAKPQNDLTVCSTEFLGLSPKDKEIDLKYVFYVFSSFSTTQLLDSMVESVTRSHQRVQPEKFDNLYFPMIPLKEQKEIIDYLEKCTSAIDTNIEKLEQQINLLKEFRKSLISSAITGKVRIKEGIL